MVFDMGLDGDGGEDAHALIVLVLGGAGLVLLAFVICGRNGGESSCDDGGLPYPLNKYV